jgi:putative transposase
MPYWKLNYHMVWSTRQRLPVLTGEIACVAQASILSTKTDLELHVHSIAVQPDHVHLAFAAPPKWSIAKIAQRVKGSSSHHLRKEFGEAWSGWQAEYGVVAFGEKSLGDVIRYVANQDEHHREDRLWLELERVVDEQTGEIILLQ